MAEREVVMCKMKDYLKHQIVDGGFVRCDVAIRSMFIAKYYKKGKPKRLSYNPYIKLIEMRDRVAKDWKFIKVIKSFAKKGYDMNYPMMMAHNFVHSGCTHRLACCLHFNIHEFPVIFNDHYADKRRDFSGERLVEFGFDQDLVTDIVQHVKEDILSKYKISLS